MRSQPANPSALGLARNWQGGLAFLALLGVCCVAISGRSFWIDEACTAVKAALPSTPGEWWRTLKGDPGSDLQMPLYMFFIWGWAKLFGASEWSLRLANFPWFVGGALAFILAFPPGDRRRVTAACAVLLCPFAWYYLDEARPYTMQLGASLLVVASLIRLASCPTRLGGGGHIAWGANATGDGRNPDQGACSSGALSTRGPALEGRDPFTSETQVQTAVILFVFGLVVLSGSSLLGMIWAGAALAAMSAVLSFRGVAILMKRWWLLWLAGGALLAAFGGFYLWTLSLGARASAAATTTFGSVLFVGYELLGFSGLGPGRLDMRIAGPVALRPYLMWVAPYGAAIAVLLGAALVQERKIRNHRHLLLVLSCCAPAAFILIVGYVAHFRVLGRHLTPLVPLFLLLFTIGLAWLWSQRHAWARVAALAFCGLSLVSCLSLRFSVRHEKDNYRAAAALAKAALSQGQVVWWNAAEVGARYYGVPLAAKGSVGADAARAVVSPSREMLADLPFPQMIITSKPDVYDRQSAISEFLREQSFHPVGQCTAFVIWTRRGNQDAR